MRVTAGRERGRTLRSPRGDRFRPTSEKVRSAIFDVLVSRYGALEGKVLDLFAGTGALGIEALSRGAERAWFVDADREACRLANENLAAMGLLPRATVRQFRLPAGIERCGIPLGQVAGALLDPPYASGVLPATLDALAASGVLADGAWVVAEHDSETTLADQVGPLRVTTRRRYGSTEVTFFECQTLA